MEFGTRVSVSGSLALSESWQLGIIQGHADAELAITCNQMFLYLFVIMMREILECAFYIVQCVNPLPCVLRQLNCLHCPVSWQCCCHGNLNLDHQDFVLQTIISKLYPLPQTQQWSFVICQIYAPYSTCFLVAIFDLSYMDLFDSRLYACGNGLSMSITFICAP